MQFYDYYNGAAAGDELFGVTLIIYLLVVLFNLAVCVAFYVMQSVSYYTIAKRRGIRKSWLAWIPVGSNWILGCISDQHRYVAKGQVKNKRKALLVLSILTYVLMAVMLVMCGVVFVNIFATLPNGYVSDQQMMSLLGSTAGLLAAYVVTMGLTIAVTVIQYIALYDLFRSCEPGNAVLYLLLCIFVSWLMPILLLICRKKDGGMPPRKADVAAAQLAAETQAEPAPAEEVWQAPAPAEEPWEAPAPEQEPWDQTKTEE